MGFRGTRSLDWQAFIVVTALVIAATAVRLWPLQAFEARLTYITFYPAVIIAALYGGLLAGLLTAFFSCLTLLFLWPVLFAQPIINDFADGLGLAIFAANSMMIAGIAETMRRSRSRAIQVQLQLERSNANLQAAHDTLEEEVIKRTEELVQTNASLEKELADRNRAEEALRESEKRNRFLASVIESASQPFAVGNADGSVLMANRAYCDLMGYTEEEMIHSHGARDLTPADFRELESSKLVEVVSTEKPVRYEKEYIRKDGTRVPVELLVQGMTNESSERLYYSFVTDLTERKEAEQKLARAYAELEQRVLDRTAELKTVNDRLVLEIEERNSAEEAAKAERQRLYDVLETLPVYVCLLDSDYRMPFANRYFRETFGASHGRRCHDFLFDRTQPCEICETYTVMKTRAPHHWYWTGPNGRDYDIYDFPFFDHDGSLLILEMGIDITERKRAEASLAAERQRLYDILETMPVMVCLLTPDYHVAFANRSFREKFGEDNGRKCFDHRFGRQEPCEFCETMHVLKTGKPHHWEYTIPDGSIIDGYDFPFTDTDGSPLILEMNIDNTERKRAEQALQIASAYNRSLIEASLDPLVTISAQGKITDVNEATERVTGYSRSELIGTDFANYFTDPSRARSGFQKVFVDGSAKNYELEIRHRGGRVTPVMYNASIYRNDSGDVVGIFAAARDITDRKRAEADLIRSNADLEKFAYVASHDLQEPLRNVASCLQLLEKKYKNKLDAEADQYIHYAVEGAVRLKVLIQDLLAYSRVGTRGKRLEPADCEQIFAQTLNHLKTAISDAGAVITHDQLPTVPADDTQLLLVFQNLISNAIKFRRDEPPQIHVSAVKNKNEWIFSVKDNGIGIASPYLERIFVIFQRLHKRSLYEGTGMGLAIVKRVVERHGGRAWVESELGVGTTVYFSISEKGMRT